MTPKNSGSVISVLDVQMPAGSWYPAAIRPPPAFRSTLDDQSWERTAKSPSSSAVRSPHGPVRPFGKSFSIFGSSLGIAGDGAIHEEETLPFLDLPAHFHGVTSDEWLKCLHHATSHGPYKYLSSIFTVENLELYERSKADNKAGTETGSNSSNCMHLKFQGYTKQQRLRARSVSYQPPACHVHAAQ